MTLHLTLKLEMFLEFGICSEKTTHLRAITFVYYLLNFQTLKKKIIITTLTFSCPFITKSCLFEVVM